MTKRQFRGPESFKVRLVQCTLWCTLRAGQSRKSKYSRQLRSAKSTCFRTLDTVSGFRDGLKIRCGKPREGSTPSRPTFLCFSRLYPHLSLASPNIVKSTLDNCA